MPPSESATCGGAGGPDDQPGGGGGGPTAAGDVGGAEQGGARCVGDVIGREALAVSRVDAGSGLSRAEEAEAAEALRRMEERENQMRHEVREGRGGGVKSMRADVTFSRIPCVVVWFDSWELARVSRVKVQTLQVSASS